MLIKASEKDRENILNYCLKEPIFNIFIIGDIENFGFSSPYQDVWYEESKEEIRGVVLRYHNNLIIYSYLLDLDVSLIYPLIDQYNIEIVSGEEEIIDKIEASLWGKFFRNDMNFCQHEKTSSLVEIKEEIIVASDKDAMKIAIAYGDIEEFKFLYSRDVDKRYEQILERIESGEGKHFIILDHKGIISHGNTSAENTMSAMIGGIFTRKDKRNKGFANQIIFALVKDLKNRNKEIALFYKNEKEGQIFKKLGFKQIGNWSTLRRIKDEKNISTSK